MLEFNKLLETFVFGLGSTLNETSFVVGCKAYKFSPPGEITGMSVFTVLSQLVNNDKWHLKRILLLQRLLIQWYNLK